MADDLTPKIVNKFDSAQLQPGGGARDTTIVRFMLGKFGPFEHTFDRNPDEFAIRAVFDERRRALQPFV